MFTPRQIRRADASVVLGSSRHDPWSELSVKEVLGGAYVRGNHSMLAGEVVAEADAREFVPYARLKWDWWPQD